MKKQKLQERDDESDNDEVTTPPRDPIEPDPMNPVRELTRDAEPEHGPRPDLDWAEHED
jgi:hypothetical protein